MIPIEELKQGFIPGIGFDPEFFLSKEGEVISADTIIRTPIEFGGTIKNPPKKHGQDWQNCLTTDGMSAEFNTIPWNSLPEVVDNFSHTLNTIFNITRDFTPLASPTVNVKKERILEAGEAAQQFGCQADISAYTGEAAAVRLNATGHLFRYSGCHIHFSPWKNAKVLNHPDAFDWETSVGVVKLMDIMFAPFILHERKEDILRRKIYGQAGSFRIQPHGVEYRTPSSNLMNNKELFVKFVEIMTRVVKSFDEKLVAPIWNIGQEYGDEYILLMINDSDNDKASVITDELLGIGALQNSDIIEVKDGSFIGW